VKWITTGLMNVRVASWRSSVKKPVQRDTATNSKASKVAPAVLPAGRNHAILSASAGHINKSQCCHRPDALSQGYLLKRWRHAVEALSIGPTLR
jgi:hypothetical protein